jgi:hypothetical protein
MGEAPGDRGAEEAEQDERSNCTVDGCCRGEQEHGDGELGNEECDRKRSRQSFGGAEGDERFTRPGAIAESQRTIATGIAEIRYLRP